MRRTEIRLFCDICTKEFAPYPEPVLGNILHDLYISQKTDWGRARNYTRVLEICPSCNNILADVIAETISKLKGAPDETNLDAGNRRGAAVVDGWSDTTEGEQV